MIPRVGSVKCSNTGYCVGYGWATRACLGVPEMGGQVVGLLPKLEGDDLAHFE